MPGEDPPHEPSSLDLFFRARDGDGAALEQLYERYLPRLASWASGRLSGRLRRTLDTSDIVQRVFLDFLGQMDSFTPRHEGAILMYLRRAILNRIRDAARRPGTEELPEGHPDPSPSPHDDAVAAQLLERYESALERLSEDERTAVFLRVELGSSHAEIARVLEKPSTDAARMFVSRALLKVAEAMNVER